MKYEYQLAPVGGGSLSIDGEGKVIVAVWCESDAELDDWPDDCYVYPALDGWDWPDDED